LQVYVTVLPNVALGAETEPLAGAVAPEHVTGVLQLGPVQPATHVPHV
jgi:hypothetical protein